MNRSTMILCIIALSFNLLSKAQKLSKPSLIKANNKIISLKPCYAAPLIYDYDKDGLKDLVIGTFNGKFRFYKNIGTSKEPLYNDSFFIKLNNEKDAKIPNW